MTNWRSLFTKAPSPTDRLIDAHIAAMKDMTLAVSEMAKASAAQAQSFDTYLSLFKVATPPVARHMRDDDEWNLELERAGFPKDGTFEQQAEWVLAQSRY